MTDTKNTVSDELLPCPFCGALGKMIRPMGERLFNKDENGKACPPYYGPDWFRVVCNNNECHCLGRSYADEADAIAAWNRRASIPGGMGGQCCMCGKTGLSTIEGDGGTECQLEDGRWTCSEPCWEKAGGYEPDLSPAEGEPDFWAVWSATGSHIGTWPDEADARAALAEYEGRIPRMLGVIKPLYAAPSNPVISDGDEEHRIEDLRFKAFRTNAPDDRQTYFDAVSKWFQHRHYRYAALSVKPQSGGDKP